MPAPCVVGFAARDVVRRNRLNPGTTRSTSSSGWGGISARVPAVSTETGAAPLVAIASVREAVTTTASRYGAGSMTAWTSLPFAVSVSGANPAASRSTVAPGDAQARLNPPSAVDRDSQGGVPGGSAVTFAPEIGPPAASRTTPRTCACAATGASRNRNRSAVSAIG